MITRAKFVCESIVINDADTDNENHYITFRAVYDDGKANKEWSRWTPAGQLMMNITNPNIFGKYVVGREYYLDIYDVEMQTHEVMLNPEIYRKDYK